MGLPSRSAATNHVTPPNAPRAVVDASPRGRPPGPPPRRQAPSPLTTPKAGPPPLPAAARPSLVTPPPLPASAAPPAAPFAPIPDTARARADNPFFVSPIPFGESPTAPLPTSAVAPRVSVERPLAAPMTRVADDIPDVLDGRARGRRAIFVVVAMAAISLLGTIGAAIASHF